MPKKRGQRIQWGQLHGAASALAIAELAKRTPGLILIVTDSVQAASQLCAELQFFLDDATIPVLNFPDWETLPYDIFSPLPELVSERLLTLYRLPQIKQGLLVVPVGTLMQRLPPSDYVRSHSLLVDHGQQLSLDETRRGLEKAGYYAVSQVMSHGEFAIRGSLIDIFPMGQMAPFRIDLLDDEVDSIRTFDTETQRSQGKVKNIRVLPAREFPLDEEGIAFFRQNYRTQFEGDPKRSLIYSEVSEGRSPGGVENYLPLFFADTATLFEYLPPEHLILEFEGARSATEAFLTQVQERYEQHRHNIERPVLSPDLLYLTRDVITTYLKACSSIRIQHTEIERRQKGYDDYYNLVSKLPPSLPIQARATNPAIALQTYLKNNPGRTLFVAESTGRREVLRDTLRGFGLSLTLIESWTEFLHSPAELALTVAPLDRGLCLPAHGINVIAESQLYGQRVRQERRRKAASRDADQIVKNLAELHLDAAVVHEDHGVGRYRGLQTIEVDGTATEFLMLEYAKGDKLYVPVSSLHLISRYTGASPETAPLHRLGGDHWEKLKRKAAERVRDVAAELLDIYARRAVKKGYAFPAPGEDYTDFAAAFQFEETPDQQQTIDSVLNDMQRSQPMDRVVCGDVGFGKTEVAMRAAFVATNSGKQVVVLVPTTLLAQQHYENFADRFADWPLRIESLSRFRTAKQLKDVQAGLAEGSVDIIIGTHKLLQPGIKFKDLGLVIVDEEHRFGVRHKERLKALRSEVDLLTLTATPIPRTLNMAMSGMRDLSIIATPPAARHPIKTFSSPWNDTLVAEACQRELRRGGQVYFLHNEVRSIDRMREQIADLLPGAKVQAAHGQLRERELESIMRDFYHQRFNILVCTTIIESGIDIPTANTIIVNRADKFGLAQLHQLRGRVGRSHHRAYAYLITPPENTMTPDAIKRLEAIESLEDLGAGFTLATHDLEIRGAGELLGHEQSGQIQEIGFSLYMDLMERAVAALKQGREPQLARPLDHGAEIDLQIPARIPDDYLPDVHNRLIIYKRIASADTSDALRDLQVEMIDRFGLLPEATKNLFGITELKLRIQPLGIQKLDAGMNSGRIIFSEQPSVDPARIIHLIQTKPKEFKLDGGNKLRFFRDLSAPANRLAQVSEVIDLLSTG